MSEIACVEIVPHTESVDSGAPVAGIVPDSRFAQFVEQVTQAVDKKGLIDRFMSQQETFPVIERDTLVHFIYRGGANEVGLTGDLVGRRIDREMHRVDGTNFFYYSAALEADARSTYKFIVNLQTAQIDSLNPR
jgi:hypothetical protein